MKQKRVLSVQDISCFGKCSNTVALPVLSAADAETVVLPTALLSTHTGGFPGYTCLDLTEEMRRITAHWRALGLRFDMIYSGYFASAGQLAFLRGERGALLAPEGYILVDPVLGDGGKLYPAYDDAFVAAMREYCRGADLITPNVTEACLLAGIPYTDERYHPARMEALIGGLSSLGCRAAVVTGVRFGADEIGVVWRDFVTGERASLSAPRSDAPLHGTGDVFASALAGLLLAGYPMREALSRTIAFVSACIRDTEDVIESHWYGVRFEGRLGLLADAVREKRLRGALRGGKS